jgi:Schlafen group 3, DNA/RNA helicase domain
VTGPVRAAAQRAYYSGALTEFCTADLDVIFGRLARKNDFELIATQRDAWLEQATILQAALSGHAGAVYLEFTIPRMGRRVDAIVIIGAVIFVLEFKVGERHFAAQDVDQVADYALDLQNFHEGSHDRYIAPVLVCTHADDHQERLPEAKPDDRLFAVARTNAKGLSNTIGRILHLAAGPPVGIDEWESSRYKPTPTIIEATLALYRGHSVADISRSDAGATNLSVTAKTVGEIIKATKARQEKAICFVTGVPGAGKTLVGLDAATRHINREDELYSVFLSGNGPLVAILQEALARDKVRQSRLRGAKIRKGAALSEVRAFIQNVHHFRDECLVDAGRPPIEHVAIFDEAQRAWNVEQTAYFMRRKRGWRDFAVSEPEFLISCLNRHQDWAVVICLVGGGQEINTGEAGIGEWFDALDRSFRDWKIYVSDRLVDSEYGVSDRANALKMGGRAACNSELHLATSIRSFRSENVSRLVKELLDLNIEAARETLQNVQTRYPIVLTRDLDTARTWLRGQARGSERYGIVVSSQAERLKPHAVDVRTPIDPVHWFLDGKDDVRSSYYLEDVATEFHVQGLELDWVSVVWDADFRFSARGWEHWSFRGNRWQRIQSMQRRRYLKNAYRVLLTRARQGMVLVVPHGDDHDPTRHKDYYDPTFDYLRDSGISVI